MVGRSLERVGLGVLVILSFYIILLVNFMWCILCNIDQDNYGSILLDLLCDEEKISLPLFESLLFYFSLLFSLFHMIDGIFLYLFMESWLIFLFLSCGFNVLMMYWNHFSIWVWLIPTLLKPSNLDFATIKLFPYCLS